MRTLALFALSLCFTLACAKTPLSTEAAVAAIRGAEEAGADQVPDAALYVRLAEEAVATATALHKQGARDEATSLLRRAEADAELAVALARAEVARAEAHAAEERLRALATQTP
jgi:hypothetical protein